MTPGRDTRKAREFQKLTRWWWETDHMAAGSVNRTRDRSCNVAFRLSPDDRALLRQRAAADGVSVQTYLERVALGRVDATDRRPGPPRPDQEALPLTG